MRLLVGEHACDAVLPQVDQSFASLRLPSLHASLSSISLVSLAPSISSSSPSSPTSSSCGRVSVSVTSLWYTPPPTGRQEVYDANCRFMFHRLANLPSSTTSATATRTTPNASIVSTPASC
jgi:hypothetical protein